jgi:hypothetical protein
MCALWLFGGVTIYIKFPVSAALIFAWVFLLLVLISASGVNWIYWMWQQYNMLEADRRRVESITPMLEIVTAVQRLTREQLEIVHAQGYHAMIGVLATRNGPVQYLMTPRGNIPMTIVERELRATGLLRFPPIRAYSDGSPEREWRRLFQAWAIYEVGLASPPDGPNPAMWIDKTGRMIAAGMLGVDIYGAKENGNEEESVLKEDE